MCFAGHPDMQKLSALDLSVENPPVKSVHRRSGPKHEQILSTNTRGFDDVNEEIVLALTQKKIF